MVQLALRTHLPLSELLSWTAADIATAVQELNSNGAS